MTGTCIKGKKVIIGLSGGVDSAVAALLLKKQGAIVEAIHMTNWEDDKGYCNAAEDLQDARKICKTLNLPLHHVNFTRQYNDLVFKNFLQDLTLCFAFHSKNHSVDRFLYFYRVVEYVAIAFPIFILRPNYN